MHKLIRLACILCGASLALAPVSGTSLVPALAAAGAAKIAPYQARFGRARAVVAVIGENSGTELTDFAIPYGVLAQSDAVDLLSVATQPGPLTMSPALHIQPQATVQQFDLRYPDGADYVIVPAVRKPDDPALLAWIGAQGAKGATIVSICDGALVVANSGLLKGHRATAHWATEASRKERYPDTQWISNVRYVADGKRVSSAGISAAMPATLALVEAIAGQARAGADAPSRVLPGLDGAPPARTLDQALAAIAASHGKLTAHRVALEFEYAAYQP